MAANNIHPATEFDLLRSEGGGGRRAHITVKSEVRRFTGLGIQVRYLKVVENVRAPLGVAHRTECGKIQAGM